MLVKDMGNIDELEVIYKTSMFCIKKIKMKKLEKIADLGEGMRESVIITLDGKIKITADYLNYSIELDKKDVCYLPVHNSFEIIKLSQEAFIIIAEAFTNKYFSPYVKRFKEMPCFKSGLPPYQRLVYVAIGEQDKADHFLVGYTEGLRGNWTSWPPHKHDDKPEVFIYYGMNDGYGLQMLVTDRKEEIYKVEDGDALIIEKGYHHNVAIPSCGINYLWIIYAESHNRNLNVKVHPKFKEVPIGETHMRLS
jgi:5-deoxy-glucuronate isomerase